MAGVDVPDFGTLIGRPPWMDQGACRGSDTRLYFAETSSSAVARALDVCENCPVRGECLEYAQADGQLEGVWGGTTARERRGMRRRVA